jgi:hypothetical protein
MDENNAKHPDGMYKYFDADEFFNQIKDFKEDTVISLENRVNAYYKFVYSNAEIQKMENDLGDTEARELRAYMAEYDVEPKGVRERSEKWIRWRY